MAGRKRRLRSRARLSISDLAFVLDAVFTARTKWYNIGLSLKLPVDTLDAIRNERGDVGDHLREMLKHWLKGVFPEPTKKALVKVLKSPTVEEARLATEVEQKLKSLRLTWITSNSQHTQLLKKTWIKILMVGLLVAVLLLWLYANNYLHLLFYALLYRFNLLHSKSLPYLPPNFVGREIEVREITDLVDFANLQNRVISIVGPPGFGKSTLAIHIGHNVVHEGVTVHYVDMIEVSSMQSLAEKVLDSDSNIVAIRNITVERLFKWARERHYRTLLILDNCDDVLHKQKETLQKVVKKLTQSSRNLKIITTSRWKTSQFNQFQYSLRELSSMASCSLLQNIVTGGINLTLCDTITNLTGNVPLALQVVGALLNIHDPAPDINAIVESLEKKLIPTLSSDSFPVEERVNASISLSYDYLSHRLQKVGRYLAHFPGSFDQEATCGILRSIANNSLTCSEANGFLNHLLERSLLEYNQRVHRYQFHRLIREFFLDIVKSNGDTGKNETRRYLQSFQSHYTDRLLHLSELFMTDHTKALAELDTEQHNILHLVKCTATPDPLIKASNYLHAGYAIHKALETGYLTTRLAAKQLLRPVNHIVKYLDEKLEALLSKKRVPSTAYSYSQLYIHCINHLAQLEEQVHGISTAVQTFLSRKHIIELIEVKVQRQEITSAYSLFYRKLSDYYGALGQHDNVKKCQHKILQKLKKELADYSRETCPYHVIGEAYYNAGDYENSIHFLQLALRLEGENISTMKKVGLMLLLYTSFEYTHKTDIIKADTVQVIQLLPSIMAAPVPEVYAHSTKVQELIDLLKKLGKDESATALEERLIEVTLQIGARPIKVSTVEQTKKLAQHLYKRHKCSKAADLAVFALESFEHLNNEQRDGAQKLKLELQLLTGIAKFCGGNVSEGLDYIELVVEFIDEHNIHAYEHYLAIACPYMIFRGRLWCVVGNVLNTLHAMISWIFRMMDIDAYLAQPNSTQKAQAQVTQLSDSKELAITTGQAMEIPLLSVISRSLFSWLYLCFCSAATAGLVTVQWFISFKIVQYLINVLLILLKQYLTYWLIRIVWFIIRSIIHCSVNVVVHNCIIIVLVLCNV